MAPLNQLSCYGALEFVVTLLLLVAVVVVEGPIQRGAFCELCGGAGSGIPKIAQIFAHENCLYSVYSRQCYYVVLPIWINDG